jgi:hypothetical protein
MATLNNLPATADEAAARFFARFGPALISDFLGHTTEAPASVEAWIALGQEVNARGATRPLTLAHIAGALAEPFALEQIELKPGATTKDKARALALPYVDLRAYQDRLDQVAGLDGWSVEYRQLGQASMICRLTILGVVREDVGEPSEDGSNPATESLAQAFKRACSAFGLGRYLYSLPKVWAAYDADARQFKDPIGTARDIYRQGGLLSR